MADGLEQQLKLLGKAIPRSAIEHQRIALVGASPEGIGAVPDGLGVFEKRSDSKRMNGAPTYIPLARKKRQSCGVLAVERGWWDRPRRRAVATVAYEPRTARRRRRQTRSHRRAGSFATRRALTAKRRRCGASQARSWSSNTPPRPISLRLSVRRGNIQRDCLGLFERSKSEFVNGYPTYHIIGTDGNDILWHAGSCWIVGNREDLGAKKGGLLCYDGSLKPECIAAGLWEVMDLKNEWVAAPEVVVVFGAQLEFERRSAAMTVALVGATPRQLHGSFVGIFERLPNRVNGLPTYKSKGGRRARPS